jgi:four helix bundle protein
MCVNTTFDLQRPLAKNDRVITSKWEMQTNRATWKAGRFFLPSRFELSSSSCPKTIGNNEDVRQLIRSSGSVAANWIEADEALSKRDFLMRVKICRKEAKESRLFLRLLDIGGIVANLTSRDALAAEARELVLIFSAIHRKEPMNAHLFVLECWNFLGIWDLGFGTSLLKSDTGELP